MDLTASALIARLTPWWSGQIGEPVSIQAAERIPGGASRQTWRLRLGPTVATNGATGGPASAPPAVASDSLTQGEFILRLDPPASLIETDRVREFQALKAFHESDVPVPEALWMVPEAQVLGGAFFVMRAVPDGIAGPLRLMQPPYVAHHARMAEQKWMTLGRIACADPALLSEASQNAVLSDAYRKPDWMGALDEWQAMLEADALTPQPIQLAALRWLRRHPPPPPARRSVVHGDYRTGNLLFSQEGELLAVLDWEMVHAGDPLEDLAWGLNRVWCFQGDERRGGLLPRDQAIALWERASGLQADPVALHWWELFSCVKGQAIWLSAAREFEQGRVDDSMMVTAAWMMINAQDRATLELMERL
jgi:aminoglycoside phosphotransferase (APT) family kinase protein